MAVAGVLEIQMRADVARLKKDMGKMKAQLKRDTKSMESSVDKLKGAFVKLAAAFGAVKIGLFLKGIVDAQEELQKLSQKLNVSVEDLAGWRHAAALAGSDAEVMTKGLRFLAKQLLDASSGLAEAVRNFDSLGIEIRDADGEIKDLIPTMLEIADRFAESEDSTLKTALAFKVFGRAGVDLIPLLNQGADAIQRQVELGNLLNPVTAESAHQSAQLIDTLLNLELSYRAVAITAVNQLLPVLVDLTDLFWEQRQSVLGAEKDFSPLVEVFKTLIILGSEFAFVWEAIGVSIFGVKHQLDGLFTGGIAGFKEARAEMEEVLVQLRFDQDVFVRRVRLMGSTEAQTLEPRQVREGRGLTPPPDIQAAAANRKAQADLLKATQKANKERREAAANEILFLETVNAVDMQILALEMDKVAAAKEADAEKLESLRVRLADEQTLVQEAFDEDMDFLMEQREQRLVSEENFMQMRLRLIETFEKERLAIELDAMSASEKFSAMSMVRKSEQVFGELANLTAGVAQHSRELFELNKVAGIADAVINAYIGISKTLATYPYPFNIALAALHGVAAFAQVQAIAGTSFQGGGAGTAPSIGGSTPAPPVTPVGGADNQGSNQTTVINFSGTTNERKMMKRFVDMLNENSRDGERITVS